MRFDISAEVFDELTLKLLGMGGLEVPKNLKKTLGRAIAEPIVNGLQNEQVPTPEKEMRYAVLLRVYSAEQHEPAQLDLSLDELLMLQKLIDAYYTTVVHGRIRDMLNKPAG